MTHEVETKILDVDVGRVAQALTSLGAKKLQDTRLIVDWFRSRGTKEGQEPWFLRIRTDAQQKSEVTWKGKSDKLGASRRHQEINFEVSSSEQAGALLIELDLEKYAHQEKNRISWEYQDWRFDLDTYPGMPSYLEIEGNSEEHIQEAIKLLELQGHRHSAEGERVLIQSEYGLNWYEMRFSAGGNNNNVMQSTSYIDKLAYIHIKDNRVLITLSKGKDTWYIPGGKREAGESDEQALIREVKEELLVDLKPQTIKHYGTFEAQAHGKPAGTVVRMTCYTADYRGELKASAEIEKYDYFSYSQKHLTSLVDHLIFEDLLAKRFIV